MVRISPEARARKEEALRAAMDRLLRGEIPPGGKADLKTLAAEAGVNRSGFYPKSRPDGTERRGPYQHLAEEFERRLQSLRQAGEVVDARAGQLERLKAENAELRERVARRDATVRELIAFKAETLSRIAAQHAEIERLRRLAASRPDNVRALTPHATGAIGPC